jgi:hypothetical protein
MTGTLMYRVLYSLSDVVTLPTRSDINFRPFIHSGVRLFWTDP